MLQRPLLSKADNIKARIQLSSRPDTNAVLYRDAGSEIADTYFSRLSGAISYSLLLVSSHCRGEALVQEMK